MQDMTVDDKCVKIANLKMSLYFNLSGVKKIKPTLIK